MPVKEIPATWHWVCDLCAAEATENHHHLPLDWAWVRIETSMRTSPVSTVVCGLCLLAVNKVLNIELLPLPPSPPNF